MEVLGSTQPKLTLRGDCGHGQPALVMPVAWGMSHEFYRSLLGELDLPLRLIHFDPAGTGPSGPLPAGWTPANIVDEAEAVRAAGNYEQIVTLGHASGAFLSIAYALEHPDRVEALILVNPFASYSRANETSNSRLAADPSWPAFQKRVAEIRRVDLTPPERFRAIFKEQRVIDMVDYGPYYFAMADAADECSFNPAMTDDPDTDFLDELCTIEAPVLIISGLHDSLVPIEESRLIAAELPYVRLIELGSSAHYPFVEQPEEFSQAVREFIADVTLDDTAQSS